MGQDVELHACRDTDVFLDLPGLGEFVKAELLTDGGSDDQPADDTAWVVREASWPRLESRAPLPPHVERMVEVYARSRPPTDASRRVVLARDAAAALPEGEPGVVLALTGAPGGTESQSRIEVREHPVTSGITWDDVGHVPSAEGPPPRGWAPVVMAGGKVWVAVREEPIRGVWIGFETSRWARTPEFVVFWANVFNWVGAGGERFASYPVGMTPDGNWQAVELAASATEPEPGLWPGLYRRASDGALRAFDAPAVSFPDLRGTPDWRERLARMARAGRGGLELAPWLCLAALACVALAAVAWKRRNLTGFSVPRSF